MTKLGEYLTKKSVNKAIVSRKTGLSKQRMGEITLNRHAKLRADELYKICLAIGVDPCEVFQYICGHLTLTEDPPSVTASGAHRKEAAQFAPAT
jgi:DNA-binding Xre family transcriptional regulator